MGGGKGFHERIRKVFTKYTNELFRIHPQHSQSIHNVFEKQTQHIHNVLTKRTQNICKVSTSTEARTLSSLSIHKHPSNPFPNPSKSSAGQNSSIFLRGAERGAEEEKRRRTLIWPHRSVSESPFFSAGQNAEQKKRRRTLIWPHRSVSESPFFSRPSCRAFPGWGRMRSHPPTSNVFLYFLIFPYSFL